MEFIGGDVVKLEGEPTELDKLVIRFVRILEKFADYVIISGYVSILLGRSRTTEDVDIFITEIDLETFSSFYNELGASGFWCLNGESLGELYKYLTDGLALRFALENTAAPNFEVKFARKALDKESFKDRLTASTPLGSIFISSLERQIAFKRYFLKSEKDLEDAVYIEKLFKDKIDYGKVNSYKRLIENEMAKTRKE